MTSRRIIPEPLVATPRRRTARIVTAFDALAALGRDGAAPGDTDDEIADRRRDAGRPCLTVLRGSRRWP